MSVAPFPTHVQIQTTTGCGAACSICPHPVESPRWSNGRMDDALFERVVGQLEGRPVRHLAPYLMADPLSDRKIFDRIERLREALPATHLEISTTGLYLSERNAQRLLATPLSELRLSCHGLTAEEWARTMPGVPHDRGWPNLLRFIERWQATRPFPLRVVTLWGLWSARRERQIAAFWRQRHIEMIRWQVVSRAEQVDLTVFGDGAAARRSPDKHDPPYACREQRDTHWLHVLSDGRVTLCCMDYRQEAIVGDLAEQTVAEVWRGGAFAAMRARVRGTDGTSPLCERCEWHVSERPAAVEVAAAVGS